MVTVDPLQKANVNVLLRTRENRKKAADRLGLLNLLIDPVLPRYIVRAKEEPCHAEAARNFVTKYYRL